jgi:hypothetical protein
MASRFILEAAGRRPFDQHILNMGLLQRQFDHKAFPHLYSAWWIAVFFLLMLIPGAWSEIWMRGHPSRKEELMGFAMFWGLVIVPFFLMLIAASLVIQVIKIVKYIRTKNRSFPLG